MEVCLAKTWFCLLRIGLILGLAAPTSCSRDSGDARKTESIEENDPEVNSRSSKTVGRGVASQPKSIVGPKRKHRATLTVPHRELSREFNEADYPTYFKLDILLEGNPTEENIKAILLQLFHESGYKNRKDVKVFIRAYFDEQRWQEGLPPVGLLRRFTSDGDKKPHEIVINKKVIGARDSPPVSRLGLSEEKRKELFLLIIHVELQALCIAYERFPEVNDRRRPPETAQYSMDRSNYLYELRQLGSEQLAKELAIQQDNLWNIMAEGSEKEWPRPPRPCDSP